MYTYRLIKYDWASQQLCYEHEDVGNVTAKALELSKTSGNDYTYRMETWENDHPKCQFRFFQDGREFTQDIVGATEQQDESHWEYENEVDCVEVELKKIEVLK